VPDAVFIEYKENSKTRMVQLSEYLLAEALP
jgi:hypothetical protein